MIFPPSKYLTQTVTFTGRRLVVDGDGNPVPDSRGNDVYNETPFDVPGCTWEPRTTSESTDNREQVVTGLTLYCADPHVDVREKDAATIDGLDYEVEGDVQRHTGSLFGNDYAEIALKRVTG